MASPQKENGFTPIANELLERVYSAPFYGSQLKIILLIFRYTYGFSRKSHSLSLSFIHKALGGNKRTIQRELQNLIDKNVISVILGASFNSSRELAINKDYEAWQEPFTQQAATTTTDGVQTTTTDGVQTTQDKQYIKQILKQDVQIFLKRFGNAIPKRREREKFQKNLKRRFMNWVLIQLKNVLIDMWQINRIGSTTKTEVHFLIRVTKTI